MPVRPACYIPRPQDDRVRTHARRLVARRNAGTAIEAFALALFLTAICLWSAIAGGLL